VITNEFEFDSTITTILDEQGKLEDVQLIIGDDVVYIRQFNDQIAGTDVYDLIEMSPKMFQDMITALSLADGAFVTRYKRGV